MGETPEWSIFERLEELEDLWLKVSDKVEKPGFDVTDLKVTARDALQLSMVAFLALYVKEMKTRKDTVEEEMDSAKKTIQRLGISKETGELLMDIIEGETREVKGGG